MTMPTRLPDSEPRPFDTGAFLEFCRSKPAGEAFNYNSNLCAFGTFLRSRGVPSFTMYGDGWNEGGTGICYDKQHPFTPEFGAALVAEPHTYSALASRLAKLVDE